MERVETSVPMGDRQSSDNSWSRQGTSLLGSVGIKVSWSDLHYTVGEKEILRGCTGTAFPGRTLAVMGGSGAGKTTLLNGIADRLTLDATHKFDGTVLLSEIKYTHLFKRCIAFVTQDDIVSPTSTPAEALFFSARIRKGYSVKQANEAVDETIEELGLTKCRNTIVGIPGIVQGLSGGEKKRTNIGVELISRPKVLILDEPTSGLDSISSLKLVTQLRELAQRSNRTILYSIHQPTAEMLQHFDDLLLMIHGKTIYHGPTEDALKYFALKGYECPSTHTPTDYYMSLMQDESLKDTLITMWEEDSHIAPTSPSAMRVTEDTTEAGETTRQMISEYAAGHTSSYGIQFVELLRRSWLDALRNKIGIMALMTQGIIFGLFAGLIFFKIKPNVTGLQDTQGLFFMVAANKAFSGCMGVVNTFPRERAVYIREQQAGAYSVFLYLFSKLVAGLPLHMIANMIEAIIIYFMADLHRAGLEFFIYYFATLFTFEVAIGIGLAVSASFDDMMLATAMAPLVIIPMMFTGGLLGSSDRIDPYWVWLRHLSLIRYIYVLLMDNQLGTVDDVACNVGKFSADFCSRQPKNGTAALDLYGLSGDVDQPWVMWTQLATAEVLVFLIALFALYKAAQKRF